MVGPHGPTIFRFGVLLIAPAQFAGRSDWIESEVSPEFVHRVREGKRRFGNGEPEVIANGGPAVVWRPIDESIGCDLGSNRSIVPFIRIDHGRLIGQLIAESSCESPRYRVHPALHLGRESVLATGEKDCVGGTPVPLFGRPSRQQHGSIRVCIGELTPKKRTRKVDDRAELSEHGMPVGGLPIDRSGEGRDLVGSRENLHHVMTGTP